jgi:hypothetical protein
VFASDNILSGHGPQIPTIIVPQNGSPRKTITLIDPESPDTVLDCVVALEAQDQASYANWAATGGSVSVGARDHWTTQEPMFGTIATAVTPTNGTFSFQVPKVKTNSPGIYLFEAGLYNSAGALVLSNAGYLEVTPSAAWQQDRYPLSIARIRRAIRDAHPRNNRVLEECEFTLAEIMDQLTYAVDEYNTTNFPQTAWTPVNFPWPSRLIDGTVAGLLGMAATWYARNDLKLQAAGLGADDMGKAQIYTALSEKYHDRWMRWVIPQKRNANIRGGWGTTTGRPY